MRGLAVVGILVGGFLVLQMTAPSDQPAPDPTVPPLAAPSVTTTPPRPTGSDCDGEFEQPSEVPVGIDLIGSTTLEGTNLSMVTVNQDAIWLAGWESGEVIRVELPTLEVTARSQVGDPYGPIGLTVSGADLWLTHYQEQEIFRLDATTLDAIEIRPLELQYGLFANARSVWVPCCGNDTENGAGTLHHLSRIDGELRTMDIPDSAPRDIAVVEDEVWVLSEHPPALIEIEPESMTVSRRIDLVGQASHLVSDGTGTMWTVDGSSANRLRAFQDGECVAVWVIPGGVGTMVATHDGVAIVSTFTRLMAIQTGNPSAVELELPIEQPQGTVLGLDDDTLVVLTGEELRVYQLLWGLGG